MYIYIYVYIYVTTSIWSNYHACCCQFWYHEMLVRVAFRCVFVSSLLLQLYSIRTNRLWRLAAGKKADIEKTFSGHPFGEVTVCYGKSMKIHHFHSQVNCKGPRGFPSHTDLFGSEFRPRRPRGRGTTGPGQAEAGERDGATLPAFRAGGSARRCFTLHFLIKKLSF